MLSAAIAGAALRAGALTRGGASAALAVGTLTFGAGGGAAAILLAFFVPSVALGRVGRGRKRALVDIAKGGSRDAAQVIANGGVATACAVAAALMPATRWRAAFAGAYAAATADTWGTEIGTLARGAPRSILTLRPIAAGLSGGVTPAGTAAEAAGACWIAAVAAAAWGTRFGPVAAGGFAGATADSLLGATAQELRRCPTCERTCETDPHACGTPTVRVRGIRGVTNDAVNLAATLVGAAVAAAFTRAG